MINDKDDRKYLDYRSGAWPLLFLSLIGVITVLIYWGMLDNFFYFDDFDWLDKVRNLGQRPQSIFNPVVHPPTAYLTPVGYIVFWLNYNIFGLEPFGYHLFSLILHILNSYLVVYFVYLLGRNMLLAILAGFFFATNFAITNAVLWPSACVDTVMFFFYMLSLIFFIFFLERERKYHYLLSIIACILSLSTKGTAVTLPIALFFTERYCDKKITLKGFLKYIPFLFIIVAYIGLLRHTLPASGLLDWERIFLNAVKLPMTLFIPEWLMPIDFRLALLCIMLFFALVVIAIRRYDSTNIGRFGILLTLIGLLPLVTIKWSFPANPHIPIESISHRLYLGSLGFAMFGSALFHHIFGATNRIAYKTVISILLAAFVGTNVCWNQKIQSGWDKVTDDTRNALNEFKKIAVQFPPRSMIYFINFPPNQGFGIQLFRLYFEPLNLNIGLYPTEIREGHDINFFIQLNGHIFNNPDDAAKLASTSWDHFYVSQFYLITGGYKKGLIELERATVTEDEKLLYQVAMTYKKLGFAQKAISVLNRTIDLNKNFVDAYLLIGELYFDVGNNEMAIKSFGEAIRLDKKDFKTMENLADLYEGRGNLKEARRLWKKALKYENRGEYRKMIERKLDGTEFGARVPKESLKKMVIELAPKT